MSENRHGMIQATYNGKIIAESGNTKKVEGNYYFPRNDIKMEYFQKANNHTLCPWKGVASYFDIEVEGQIDPAAAWTYNIPFPLAWPIKGYVAFWNDVKVSKVKDQSNA